MRILNLAIEANNAWRLRREDPTAALETLRLYAAEHPHTEPPIEAPLPRVSTEVARLRLERDIADSKRVRSWVRDRASEHEARAYASLPTTLSVTRPLEAPLYTNDQGVLTGHLENPPLRRPRLTLPGAGATTSRTQAEHSAQADPADQADSTDQAEAGEEADLDTSGAGASSRVSQADTEPLEGEDSDTSTEPLASPTPTATRMVWTMDGPVEPTYVPIFDGRKPGESDEEFLLRIRPRYREPVVLTPPPTPPITPRWDRAPFREAMERQVTYPLTLCTLI